MSTNIHELQRKAQMQKLDEIARETLYSIADQFAHLLKDENVIDVSDVYFILNEASQQLFQKAIVVADSTRFLGMPKYSCTNFTSLKGFPKNGLIPEECLTCPKLIRCFKKRTEV